MELARPKPTATWTPSVTLITSRLNSREWSARSGSPAPPSAAGSEASTRADASSNVLFMESPRKDGHAGPLTLPRSRGNGRHLCPSCLIEGNGQEHPEKIRRLASSGDYLVEEARPSRRPRP